MHVSWWWINLPFYLITDTVISLWLLSIWMVRRIIIGAYCCSLARITVYFIRSKWGNSFSYFFPLCDGEKCFSCVWCALRGGQWNSGGQCHKETEPIFNAAYLPKYPSKMRAFEHVLLGMKTPVTYLNISRLTGYRKDGHPSIYRMQYKTAEEQIAAERSQDCSHWCLPGVPDTWNELLYVSLLKAGRGSWKMWIKLCRNRVSYNNLLFFRGFSAYFNYEVL